MMLRQLERQILSHLKVPYRGSYVDVGKCVGEFDKIWTLSLNTSSQNTPLVLLHGMGAGVALWVLNLDAFAQERPVYAIDILGFGRSSRPRFEANAMVAEKQFVKSIEEWRKEMKLQKVIILGHSMGGFLAASYALSYPERVKHLILADPWGFPEKPPDYQPSKNIPLWARTIYSMTKSLNPLWIVRFAGPYGPSLLSRTRPDILNKFCSVVSDPMDIANYIHQCNAQNPTGESAFHAMCLEYGWAKNPMINRIQNVKSNLPITFLYGEKSWVDNNLGETSKQLRKQSFVDVKIINGAGHHIYADNADDFNKHVKDACNY